MHIWKIDREANFFPLNIPVITNFIFKKSRIIYSTTVLHIHHVFLACSLPLLYSLTLFTSLALLKTLVGSLCFLQTYISNVLWSAWHHSTLSISLPIVLILLSHPWQCLCCTWVPFLLLFLSFSLRFCIWVKREIWLLGLGLFH